ncbi:hypothetical protein HDU84_002105 [Entophlyctis sp. JEL0112]|nr:hypothetical protein HDU84_002105 [Entophlyctis sp. JEL0112]
MCFTCSAIAFAFIYLAAEGDHFDVAANGAHVAIGPVVLALMIFQMTTGYIINHLYVPTRTAVPWWDQAHHWTGRILFLLALANIPLGILLYSASSPSPDISLWLWVGFQVWLIVIAITLAYLEGRKQAAQAAHAVEEKLRSEALGVLDAATSEESEPDAAATQVKHQDDGPWCPNEKLNDPAADETIAAFVPPDVLAARYLSVTRNNAEISSTMGKDPESGKGTDALLRLYEGYESLLREQQLHQQTADLSLRRESNATTVETAHAGSSWDSLPEGKMSRTSSCGVEENRCVAFASPAAENLSLASQKPELHQVNVENGESI